MQRHNGRQAIKAIRIPRAGDSSVMEFVDIDRPAPASGEALVRIEAAGINFADILQRLDNYANRTSVFPYIAGLEAGGVVAEIGAGVEDLAVGDRVGAVGVLGCYAEFNVFPAERLIKLPPSLDTRAAAACLLQGLTAHALVHDVYAVAVADWVLVHAGAGGMGLVLIQMAKALGATVVTTVSTQAKADLARGAGADHVILYTQADFAPASRALDGFPGYAVIYDAVGGPTLEKGLELLRPRGVMASYGKAGGDLPRLDLDALNRLGSLTVSRPSLVDYIRTPQELQARANAVLAQVAAGDLNIRIGATYPLAEAARAHEHMAGRATTGKLLLIP